MELTLAEALKNGIAAHQAGQISEADRLYTLILKAQPNHADANHNMGVLAVGIGKTQDALPFFKAALEANPNIAQFWQSYSGALMTLGRLAEAKTVFDQAKEKGANGEAFNQLDQQLKKLDKQELKVSDSKSMDNKSSSSSIPNILDTIKLDTALRLAKRRSKGGLFEEAKRIYQDIVQKFPKNKQALIALQSLTDDALLVTLDPPSEQLQSIINRYTQGHLQQALSEATKMLMQFPTSVVLYNISGAANFDLMQFDAAIDNYKQAIKIKPDYADAYYNMGVVQKDKGDLAAAIHSYKQAIKINPSFANAYHDMGNALNANNEQDAAINSYKQAIRINPNLFKAYNNIGHILSAKGDQGAAIDSYKKALKIRPNYVYAYNNMGVSLADKGEIEASIECYKQALKIKPDYAEAYYNMGHALVVKGELEPGIKSLEMALKFKQDYHSALSRKLHQQARICDWTGIQKDQDFIPTLGITDKAVDPFEMIALEDAPERHRLRSEIYAKLTFTQTPLPFAPKPPQKPQRLRIGYFSADFKNHPVMYALIEVLEQHNRALFEVYAYAFGPDSNSEMRQRVMRAVDVFNHVKDMDDQTIALLARQDKIDIAIDLTCYTRHSRTGVFAYRAAPVQIAMLGYPGTSGTTFIDYIVTDQTLLPPGNQKFFSETPIYLPYSQCALETSVPLLGITPTRSELGLPEVGFVFCAINSTYKITLAEFDIWMRLLRQVDGSVLWLLESNQWARGNLVKEAEARGVDSKRLVFQPLMVTDAASQQQYLSQFRQADLYLDTFTYGAGSTAANALWAALPVLTLIGQGMSTRMAASYLNVLGLSELITTTHDAYEKLAFHLSTNPERLALLKQKLADALLTTPLFDNALQTKYLENGYQQAYQRYFDDQSPTSILVPEHLL
jgi:protein O-GlcNAc transferase